MEWTESNIVWGYDWYPAGDGKYELAIGYASGPDVGNYTVFWLDAPGKVKSQGFGDSQTLAQIGIRVRNPRTSITTARQN